MSRSRRLLKSIEPRADESIQSIAMRLAPLALVTPNELLRFGNAAGLASLPTDTNATGYLSELGGFAPADIRSRGITRGNIGYIIYNRQVPFDWVSFARSPARPRCSDKRRRYALPPPGLATECT
jgi:hypothetical protein